MSAKRAAGLSWLNIENAEQIQWAEEYLEKRPGKESASIRGFSQLQRHGKKLEQTAEGRELVQKMKGAWRSKKSWKARSASKNSVVLDSETWEKIRTMAYDARESPTVWLSRIVAQMHRDHQKLKVSGQPLQPQVSRSETRDHESLGNPSAAPQRTYSGSPINAEPQKTDQGLIDSQQVQSVSQSESAGAGFEAGTSSSHQDPVCVSPEEMSINAEPVSTQCEPEPCKDVPDGQPSQEPITPATQPPLPDSPQRPNERTVQAGGRQVQLPNKKQVHLGIKIPPPLPDYDSVDEFSPDAPESPTT